MVADHPAGELGRQGLFVEALESGRLSYGVVGAQGPRPLPIDKRFIRKRAGFLRDGAARRPVDVADQDVLDHELDLGPAQPSLVDPL